MDEPRLIKEKLEEIQKAIESHNSGNTMARFDIAVLCLKTCKMLMEISAHYNEVPTNDSVGDTSAGNRRSSQTSTSDASPKLGSKGKRHKWWSDDLLND
jgi:hypothetical protein